MNHWRLWMVFLTVVAIVYAPSFQNGSVLDDRAFFVENRDLDIPLSKWLFNESYFDISREISYRPVVTLTHWMDRRWGVRGGHLFNMSTHLLVGCGLFLLGKKFLSIPAAAWGTLLFLVHPAYSEAVYSSTYREDLLCALFLLWTLLAAAGERPTLAGICFGLALFSKETAIPLPVFLIGGYLIFDWKQARPWKMARRSLPVLLCVDLAYVFIRFLVLPGPAADIAQSRSWLWQEGAVWTGYLKLLIFPVKLSVDHRPFTSLRVLDILPGLAALMGWAFYTAFQCTKKNAAALPGLWFFFFLLPVMDIVPILHPSAERYLYVPLLIPSLSVGYIMTARKKSAEAAAGSIWRRAEVWACILLVVMGARTCLRGYDFRNPRSLYSAELAVNPGSLLANVLLGEVEMQEGDTKSARARFEHALTLDPFFHRIYFDLGSLEDSQGRHQEALRWYEAAHAASPTDPEALIYLADSKRRSGDTLTADLLYRKAAELHPRIAAAFPQDFLDFHRNLQWRYARR